MKRFDKNKSKRKRTKNTKLLRAWKEVTIRTNKKFEFKCKTKYRKVMSNIYIGCLVSYDCNIIKVVY